MTETTQQDSTTSPAIPVDIEELLKTVQQREWLAICRALEAPKEDVVSQSELMFPAIVWLNRKRRSGGADWDAVLDLTDPEVYAELGIETDDEDEADPEGKENASATSRAPQTSLTSTPIGDSVEPASVSAPDSVPTFTTA